jgi:uncharacterized membrane protein
MYAKLKFQVRQLWYDLHTGLLFRPVIITIALSVLAGFLVVFHEKYFATSTLEHLWPFVFAGDMAAAQVVLSTLSSSMITVVSIIYSILVMALTLASMQFSPRILHEFMRDRTSQNMLGIFIGTFIYCLITLRSLSEKMHLSTVHLATSLAIFLALFAFCYLIYFIHHISQLIQINYIVDIIADQTDEVIDSDYPEKLEERGCGYAGQEDDEYRWNEPPQDSSDILASRSGYVQLIDEKSLSECAQHHQVALYLKHAPGEFVIEGTPLVIIHPAGHLTEEVKETCLKAFDLGPVRTMQQDIEFGIRQIVDVALKAISPAVNDPTTACTCIDHLARVISRLASRRIRTWHMTFSKQTGASLHMRRTTFRSALDLAFSQIRQYGKGDPAVLGAMMKALAGISNVTRCSAYRSSLQEHATMILKESASHIGDAEKVELVELQKLIQEPE